MTKLFPIARVVTLGSVGVAVTLCVCLQVQTSAQQAGRQQVASPPSSSAAGVQPAASSPRRLLDRYCVTCHNERLKTADLRLDRIDVANPGADAEVWEKVVRKLHTGTMPPPNMPQPSEDDRRALLIVAGNIARCGFRRQTESWPHGNAPPPESDRVSERRSETCWRSTSTPPRSCRPMRAVTASTT